MAAAIAITDAGKYGKNGENVASMMDRLMNIDWFHHVGKEDPQTNNHLKNFMEAIGVDTYQMKWTPRDEVPQMISRLSLENSVLWGRLKNIPDEIKEKVEAAEHETELDELVYHVPELVYHGAFEGAYRMFEDEKTVAFLAGHAMYISVLACAWELADDPEGTKENPFHYAVCILEDGHLPLGPIGNTIYLS
ncbi:hypothetical protein [Salibacterium aidingense]|uniref:hypothetical protein n=1 Tax=Salibacterium aidingense TaxID=384933 RepID=UPI003BC7DA38